MRLSSVLWGLTIKQKQMVAQNVPGKIIQPKIFCTKKCMLKKIIKFIYQAKNKFGIFFLLMLPFAHPENISVSRVQEFF